MLGFFLELILAETSVHLGSLETADVSFSRNMSFIFCLPSAILK